MRPTVTIVAGEELKRERWAKLLTAGGLDVAATAADPFDLPLAEVVVVGCSTPSPERVLAEAALACPGSRVVAILSPVSRGVVRRALRAGAAAVVREDRVPDALVIAVQGACAGQLSIPLDYAGGLEKPILSAREKQILGMVVMGFTNGQVARRLFLAESTVKSHMSSIFGKLGVCSRKEAVAVVLDPEYGLGLGILAISDVPAPPTPVEKQAGACEETAA